MLDFARKAMNALLILLGVMLLVMVGLGIWNIAGRYLFDKALLWADEVLVFAMIVMAWLGVIICAWRGADIRMTVITDMFPESVRRVLETVQHLVVAALCLWVAWLSWGYVSRLYKFGMKSDAAQIPVWTVHASVTLGLAVVGVVALLRFVRLLTGKPGDLTAPVSMDRGK